MADADKLKHLELIQAVVNRLATSSFLLKGWTVVLVSALFALAAKDAKPVFLYVAFLPAVAFWGLDGYFLSQERLFRTLYDRVRLLPADQVDFSMNVAAVASGARGWMSACFSKTLGAFHGSIIITIVLVASLIHRSL
jgi:hypothetical protein